MFSPKIILASTSPYRKELLARLHLPFETASPEIEEDSLPNELPIATALRLSEAKARAVAVAFPDALIIGSDQVAFLGDEVFGKPGTHEKAVSQLHALSGQTVSFSTGLCLLNTKTYAAQLTHVMTQVTFRPLTSDAIERYLHIERPYNCAGSAKSEGLGIALIAKIDGEDPNALIGLPLIALCSFLKNEHVSLV